MSDSDLNMTGIGVRRGGRTDLAKMHRLFSTTIVRVCAKDYDFEQRQVWIASIHDTQRWLSLAEDQYLLVAYTATVLCGFASLKEDRHVDMLYVHPDSQLKGAGRLLFSGLREQAGRMQQATMTADVSITARPFFEKMGFKVLKDQWVERNGILLPNLA
ncbi:putative acetyltransferase, partial [Dyadobacter jejuensis]